MGEQWNRETLYMHGRAIVNNTLLIAQVSYRARVNGISDKMRKRIMQMTKNFIWQGNKARLKWEILTKHPNEGGFSIRDPLIVLDTSKIMLLKKVITNTRQPWMKWMERRLGEIATKWKVQEAMTASPTKKQLRELKNENIMESAIKIWFEIGGRKRDERIITYEKHKIGEQVQEWESGFGIGRDPEDM